MSEEEARRPLTPEEYLSLTEAEKEIYIAIARERIHALFLEKCLEIRAECPYRGLEICLQHCVCELGEQ